jgi:type I restriction enzyme M protein
VPGFCRAATTDEIALHNYALTPGRYVGVADLEDDDVPFEDRMRRLVENLFRQQAEGQKLDITITASLRGLGYGG